MRTVQTNRLKVIDRYARALSRRATTGCSSDDVPELVAQGRREGNGRNHDPESPGAGAGDHRLRVEQTGRGHGVDEHIYHR